MADAEEARGVGGETGCPSSIPPHAGVAIVVSYLLLYDYGGQLLRFPFWPVVERLGFLIVVLTILTGGMGLPLSHAVGRLDVPVRTQARFLAFALMVTIMLRLAVKLVAIGVERHGTDTLALTGWNFIVECIIPPLNEEPIFRGLMLLSLVAILGHRRWQAILLAAMIFCSVHNVHDVEQQIATLLLGCLLGFVFLRTRSLGTCMVLHSVWNAMIFVKVTVW
jgi:membrane protease YdiL (CAAX protease family)